MAEYVGGKHTAQRWRERLQNHQTIGVEIPALPFTVCIAP